MISGSESAGGFRGFRFILAFILSREHRKILEGDPGKSGGGTAENKDYAELMGIC